MKYLLFLSAFTLLHAGIKAQNLDSFFAQPQIIELTVSTPQPRLKETFQVKLDFSHIKANIFKSLIGKFDQPEQTGYSDDQLTLNLTALNKGRNEIGPLKFTIDKTTYTTNPVHFEVIDPLPTTDRGLWFRKVITSDSTFCMIIEQRIPAENKQTTTGNLINFTTEPETTETVKFKYSYSINGLRYSNSNSQTNFSSFTNSVGEDKQFMYSYSVYYFIIEDRQAKIMLTADLFENLPTGYEFKDIVIQ